MKAKRIRFILDILYSEADKAGTRYWAFRCTLTSSGRQVCGTIRGGESNIMAMFGPSYLDMREHFYYTTHGMKKSAFRDLTADWPHAGSHPGELAKWVAKRLLWNHYKPTSGVSFTA